VEHIVILMQENRSFDHYFGTLRGVRGFGDPRVAQLSLRRQTPSKFRCPKPSPMRLQITSATRTMCLSLPPIRRCHGRSRVSALPPAPYALQVTGDEDRVGGAVRLTFTNSGAAAAVFQVRSAVVGVAPRTYTVGARQQISDLWKVTGGVYDLSVHGPNGFLHSFAGDFASPTVSAAYDAKQGSIRLDFLSSVDIPIGCTSPVPIPARQVPTCSIRTNSTPRPKTWRSPLAGMTSPSNRRHCPNSGDAWRAMSRLGVTA